MNDNAEREADPSVNDPAPPVYVDALIRDIDADPKYAYHLLIKFPHIAGGTGELQIERSQSLKPSEVAEALLNAGALLPLDKKQAIELVKQALAGTPRRNIEITRRTGWVGDSFVGRGWTEGPAAD